jgi:tryptophanase
LQNLREVRKISGKYKIPLFLDSARFAENAWFIKQREEEFRNKSIPEIVREMFSLADGMTMSAKKDGIVNIGGFIGFRNQELFNKASLYNIMFEGYITYGGMAGRDMAALAVGLREATSSSYLHDRIGQVERLGKMISAYGIPIQQPVGGHAVFVDALKFLPLVPREEFPAQTLAVQLYIEAGIRSVEIGTLMADRDPQTRENRYPVNEFVRLAIPRRVYTDNHMNYIAAALRNLYDRRTEITSGFSIVKEAEIMRHFTVELKRRSKP